MADYRNVDTKIRARSDGMQALLAAQGTAAALVGDITDHLDPTILATLHNAMLSHSSQDGRAAVRQAVMTGVRAEDIADLYVPTLARGYGHLWCEDELTFGEVTIAVSRLQSVLRDLEAYWPRLRDHGQSNASVLLINPRDVFHTLGAFVLSGQLRRKGISVKMSIGGNAKSVREELSTEKFDAIFISASQSDSLESLKLIIDAVIAATTVAPPIVIGGALLEVESANTVTARTGADFATGNAEEALRHCGLLLTTQEDAPTSCRG
ncbi:cobalamin B12-binding domain-containing protein [Yoonia sp.]|uniref:cobalamin B12-binding domain-containing protein n=1 Tax=Yoonia sp. TaxID=2212373 RepID=UPI002FDB7C5A